VDIWKKNVLEDLKIGKLKFPLVGDFLAKLKKEFSRENDKLAKIAELKRIE